MTEPVSRDSANAVLLDRAIHHALLAERFKASEVRRILRVLDREVIPDLAGRLAARLENIAARGFDVGFRTTARLRALDRDLRNFHDDLVVLLRDETEGPLVALAVAHAAQLARDVKREVGDLASVVTPSAGMIRSAVLRRPFYGALLRERWSGRARSLRIAVDGQVRIGLMQGETPTAIVARVRALWPAQRRVVAGTVQSAVSHAQEQARQAVYEANRDLLLGVMWTATLSAAKRGGTTCPICGALDGQVFQVDEGPRPPRHPFCRCTTSPVLKSANAIAGIDLGATRASMDGQVPDAVTFAEWIDRQSLERQDAVFGPGRAALFRAGKVDLASMVDAAGHLIPLGRLVELAGL